MELPDRLDATWLSHHLKPTHPRLLVDEDTFESIRALSLEDENLQTWLTDLRAEADAAIMVPPAVRVMEGRRMLSVSRQALQRLLALSFVYRLDGNERHLDRAKEELNAVLAFDDWNPSHYLDTAEMSLAVCLADDWLNDALPDQLRHEIRTTLWAHVINPAIGPEAPDWWWLDAANNWNSICWNGLALAALTIAEDRPEAAAAVLNNIRRYNPAALATYAPDGVYPEGPSYWNFGTSHQVMLLDALESALGTDLGLTLIEPGFAGSDRFLIHATAPSGKTFNFADADPKARRRNEPALEWFAWRFGRRYDTIATQPLSTELVTSKASIRFETLRPIWYTKAISTTPRDLTTEPPPLAWHGQGPQPVAMFRSSWADPDAAYLGTKGGRASVNHGHMDAGGFVFEAMGVRWAHDLGRQDYHGLEEQGFDGLFDREQDSPRWSLFRMGPFSHNTITLNGQLHDVDATGRLIAFEANANFGEATYDLSEVLPEADGWFRGFRFDHAGAIRVADRLSGLAPGTKVRWAMLTQAEIMLASDGRSATLTDSDESIHVEAEAPDGFRFRSAPAENDPPFPFDEPNPDFTLLVLEGETTEATPLALEVSLFWDLAIGSAGE